jgi:hypothetical protein
LAAPATGAPGGGGGGLDVEVEGVGVGVGVEEAADDDGTEDVGEDVVALE